MVIFGKYNSVFFVAIYLAILNTVYSPYSIWLSVFFIFFVYSLLIFRSAKLIILFPFFLYPFMFLIRAQAPENMVLVIMPEIFVIFAILVHLLKCGLNNKHILLLGSFAYITVLILMFHVNDFRFFPVILRQYVLPIIFMIVFIEASAKASGLAIEALKITVISFAIVGMLSLLNIFNIVEVKDSIDALYPYLNYLPDVVDSERSVGGRGLSGGILIPRLNLFTGGALGSSAAIFFALGLIPFLLPKNEIHWTFKLTSIFLIVPSLMTFSSSIVISFSIFLFVIFGLKKGGTFLKIGVLFLILFSIFILMSTELFIDKSLFAYFSDSLLAGMLAYMQKIDAVTFLIGSGPRLTSAGYEFMPSVFVTDAGILRVFIETGFFNFILFLVFLIIVFRRGILVFRSHPSYDGRLFFMMFIIFICLVHANMTTLPPFFPLFSAIVGGIFSIYYNVNQKIQFSAARIPTRS